MKKILVIVVLLWVFGLAVLSSGVMPGFSYVPDFFKNETITLKDIFLWIVLPVLGGILYIFIDGIIQGLGNFIPRKIQKVIAFSLITILFVAAVYFTSVNS